MKVKRAAGHQRGDDDARAERRAHAPSEKNLQQPRDEDERQQRRAPPARRPDFPFRAENSSSPPPRSRTRGGRSSGSASGSRRSSCGRARGPSRTSTRRRASAPGSSGGAARSRPSPRAPRDSGACPRRCTFATSAWSAPSKPRTTTRGGTAAARARGVATSAKARTGPGRNRDLSVVNGMCHSRGVARQVTPPFRTPRRSPPRPRRASSGRSGAAPRSRRPCSPAPARRTPAIVTSETRLSLVPRIVRSGGDRWDARSSSVAE